MKTFYTADTHFHHRKIMEYCPNRGDYADSAEHDEMVIEIWNNTVAPRDEVWILGDFAFGTKKQVLVTLEQLNGRLNFVTGNHDESWIRSIARMGLSKRTFHNHQAIRRIPDTKNKVLMSHFPYETWAGNQKKTWHFHGHTHGKSPFVYLRRDVGWDVFGRPVTFEEITNYSPYKEEGKQLELRY